MSEKGFSLIEVMIVIALIALMTGITTVAVIKVSEHLKRDAAETQIGNFKTALTVYYERCGRYPTTVEGLEALIEPPGSCADWVQGLDAEQVPTDPWNRPYAYYSPPETEGRTYEIICRGASLEESKDDIVGFSTM